MKQVVALILIVSFMFVSSGCSLFVSRTQTMTVTASERDAEIFINGNMVGVGTASEIVRRNENATIMVKKKGFYPATRNISKTMSNVGIVDCVGGFIWLIPFFGLLAPGAWELQQTNISVCLSKIEEE